MTDAERLQKIRAYIIDRVEKRFKRLSTDEVYAKMRYMDLDDIADDISDYTDIIMDLREMLEVEG